MKQLLSIAILVLLNAFAAQAQNRGFAYQAALRNNNGVILPNQNVDVYFYLEGGPNSMVLYSEKHSTTSNALGLVNLVVGSGAPLSGNFSTINWATPKSLRVAIDVNNQGPITLGNNDLLAVPYAFSPKTLVQSPELPSFRFSPEQALLPTLLGSRNKAPPMGKSSNGAMPQAIGYQPMTLAALVARATIGVPRWSM